MVVLLSKSYNKPTFFTNVPVIDLSNPDGDSKTQVIVNACKEFGFFKVTNHGVPMELITRLESEALNFFSLPNSNKEKYSSPPPPNKNNIPFGTYGNKRIGLNGDMGWVEYLLFPSSLASSFKENPHPHFFWLALNDYISAVKILACEVLELLAKGLVNIKEKNVFSKLLMDEESDSVFRLNHYPPCPDHEKKKKNHQGLSRDGEDLIGFGEHTDPQIISVLRSNNTEGLQIFLRDKSRWVSIPPDETSFFVIVGDSLQVMSNGRFRSVRHRVLTNSLKSRVSMIYFGGPALSEKISPLPSLMEEGEESMYKEFTWFEYKKSAYESRLADNRLAHFELIKEC